MLVLNKAYKKTKNIIKGRERYNLNDIIVYFECILSSSSFFNWRVGYMISRILPPLRTMTLGLISKSEHILL